MLKFKSILKFIYIETVPTAHPISYPRDTDASFLWGKAGGARSWPLISI
jgi:hypothetical protein